jgi:hypothetical protein
MSRVLLACGGTGGHLAPGIALAQRLTEDGHECLLIVSSKVVDARMTSNYPRLNFIPGKGRGFGPGLVGKAPVLPRAARRRLVFLAPAPPFPSRRARLFRRLHEPRSFAGLPPRAASRCLCMKPTASPARPCV